MVPSEEKDKSALQRSGELYGRDYYFGKSSGYPAEGYAELRGSWCGWLALISQIKAPPGLFIDLGSAYGYLVSAARETGYQALGCDISTFALQQEVELKSFLARADVHLLPFQASSADVVTLFDVLEHLEEPERCLQEAVRILKSDGLLVGTTPDPIHFDRKEETHCFERPPAFWLFLLRKLGLAFQFRFSVTPYNFQFVAAKPATSAANRLRLLQHDYFSEASDFITVKPDDQTGSFHAVPRFGWGPLADGTRELKQTPASIYLLNTGSRPIQSTVQLTVNHSRDFSTLRIRLDSHVLRELHLTSEETVHSIETRELLIPVGGHHLFFDLFPGGPEVTVSNIRFEVAAGSSDELISQLPFDLQQRYCLAGEIAEILDPQSVLDVGGLLGDKDGHLATSEDFLRPQGGTATVTTTDLRQCDHPSHHPCEATKQPFPSGTFDLVVSLDVLEHIPEQRRKDYFRELDRISSRWILLGAPFASKTVETLEASLADQLDLDFLKEHRQFGLPEHALVEEFFATGRGYSIKAFPNGYLPTWGAMQTVTQHLFAIRDHRVIKEFNRLYQRHLYKTDQRVPSYRTIYLISKGQFSHVQLSKLDRIIRRSGKPNSGMERFSLDPDLPSILGLVEPVLSAQSKALSDVQFLINERQKAIRSLTTLNQEIQSMPLWKVILKRLRRRLTGSPPK